MLGNTKRPRIRKGLVASTWRKVTLSNEDLHVRQVYSELNQLSKHERTMIKMRVAYQVNQIVGA